jgi:hypothetical protein
MWFRRIEEVIEPVQHPAPQSALHKPVAMSSMVQPITPELIEDSASDFRRVRLLYQSYQLGKDVKPIRSGNGRVSASGAISLSDVDSREMEEEILRQIQEEGLLDGIDLDHIDISQEDEISERIAQAFRRRQHERSRVGGSKSPSTWGDKPERRGRRRIVEIDDTGSKSNVGFR